MNSAISLEERKQIKKSLKFGDIAQLSRLSGLSKSTIRRWFNGEGDNENIPYAISRLLNSRNNAVKSLHNSLKLINK